MDPIENAVGMVKQNAHYHMQSETDVNLLTQGVEMLASMSRYNAGNGTVDFGNNGIDALRGITRALIIIETAKIHLFARVAKEALLRNANQKVVICVNYTETINDLIGLLSDFNPLRLDGGMSINKRMEALECFQAGNTDCRLLIGNLSVCSTGIDLDDQYGQFPRLCLVSPNYSTISLYQLSHRFNRLCTKSVAVIHFVVGAECPEIKILNAIARKSAVMKEVVVNQAEHGVIFPGDYEMWEEPQ
jgi:hypothetical protein